MNYVALLNEWMIFLQAERKSPNTITSYTDGVRGWLAYCDRAEREPVLDRSTVAAYTADMLANGNEGATARARQFGVRRFSQWLAEEGIIERDELLGIKPPRLDVKMVPRLSETELGLLLDACKGKGFRSLRDEAIIRLMIETALRAGEVVAMTCADTDVAKGVAIIRRGKGGKGRPVPFGKFTQRSMLRYLRVRATHAKADTSQSFWLGDRGCSFGYEALSKTLAYRGNLAGIKGFHAHVLRHTAAQRWLDAGGSEGGLMSVAGWSRREMMDRYTKATAAGRAATEAHGLDLGNI